MELLRTGMARRLLIADALLPVAAVAAAYWGSTWGWNSDGRLSGEILAYLGASYLVYFFVGLAIYLTVPSLGHLSRVVAFRPGVVLVMWGAFVLLDAVFLIHLFNSEALWFGSTLLFYLGFTVLVAAVIRSLAG